MPTMQSRSIIAEEGDYTLVLGFNQATVTVRNKKRTTTIRPVKRGEIKLMSAWYDYALDAIIDAAQETCQRLNFGGKLYDPNGNLIRTISDQNFRVRSV